MLLKERILNITGIRDRITSGESSSLVAHVNTYLNDILPYEVRPVSLEKVITINGYNLDISGLRTRSIYEAMDAPIKDLTYPANRYTSQEIADISTWRESIYQRIYQRILTKEEDFKQLSLTLPTDESYLNMYTPFRLDSDFINHYKTQVCIYRATDMSRLMKIPVATLEFYKSPRIHMVADNGFAAFMDANEGKLIVYAFIPGQYVCTIHLPRFVVNGLTYIGDDGEVYGSKGYVNFYNKDFKVTVKPMLLTHIDDDLDQDLHGLEQIIAHGTARLIMLAYGGSVSSDVELSYNSLLRAYDRKHNATRAIRNNPKPILHSTR